MNAPSWIEIDLKQFEKNMAAIRKRVGGRKVCLPVKANAYGHGLVPMGQAAERIGIEKLGVFSLAEARALRGSGVKSAILIFGAIHEWEIGELIGLGVEFTISSEFKADLVADYCALHGLVAKVHLEVDTGMCRTGMRPETALRLYRKIQGNRSFEIVGIYTHFATSETENDPFVYSQMEQFLKFKEKIDEPLIWHVANSGGVCFYPESYLDMVRPGLLSYGIWPDRRDDEEIRPIFSLRAKISFFKVVGANVGISYDHLYRTKEETRVVTVPVGYGDGYARSLMNVAPLLIRGKRYKVAGKICMDQFMVDIGKDEAYVGEVATLIGADGKESVSLAELAALAKTDPREILSHLNERIPRVYLG